MHAELLTLYVGLCCAVRHSFSIALTWGLSSAGTFHWEGFFLFLQIIEKALSLHSAIPRIRCILG